MSKRRIFHVAGRTAALKDGHQRDITLVAVLTSKPEIRTSNKEDETIKKTTNGFSLTKVETTFVDNITEYTLSFGLSVVAPQDVHKDKVNIEKYNQDLRDGKKPEAVKLIVTADAGFNIAVGKATKPKSALAVLKTDERFFTKTVIEGMLKAKLKHIIEDPDAFITVSPANRGATIGKDGTFQLIPKNYVFPASAKVVSIKPEPATA